MADTETGGGGLGKLETSAGTVELDRVDVVNDTGDCTVLRVEGALDLALAPKLQQLVERAARMGPALIVIDLTGVTFLASAGMAVLVRAQRQKPEHTVLRVVAASRITLRPLEMTRLTDELAMFPTLADALVQT
jgi:anti-anti-sigma factor